MSTNQENVTTLLDVMSVDELRWQITDKLDAKSLMRLSSSCSAFFNTRREASLVSNERRERLEQRYAKAYPLCPLPERHDNLSYRKSWYDAAHRVWESGKANPRRYEVFQFVRRNNFTRKSITKFIRKLHGPERSRSQCQKDFYRLFLQFAFVRDRLEHPLFQLVSVKNQKILNKIYQWALDSHYDDRVSSLLQVAAACRQTDKFAEVFRQMYRDRDIYDTGGICYTALDIVVLNGDVEGIDALEKLDGFYRPQPSKYRKALFYCIQMKDKDTFKCLINHLKPYLDITKIEFRDEFGERSSFLAAAVEQRWFEGVELMLNYGFDSADTALRLMARFGWVEGISALLNHQDYHFFIDDVRGLTRMIAACTHANDVADPLDDDSDELSYRSTDKCVRLSSDCHDVPPQTIVLAKLIANLWPERQLKILQAIKTYVDEQQQKDLDESLDEPRACIQWPDSSEGPLSLGC